MAAGTGPLCEQPPGSAVDEDRSKGVGGIHRVSCVSCAGPRTWHEYDLLGGKVFVALHSLCACCAAGSFRVVTSFFVNIALMILNAKRDTLDLIILLNRKLCAHRTSSRSGSNKAIGVRHFQAAR